MEKFSRGKNRNSSDGVQWSPVRPLFLSVIKFCGKFFVQAPLKLSRCFKMKWNGSSNNHFFPTKALKILPPLKIRKGKKTMSGVQKGGKNMYLLLLFIVRKKTFPWRVRLWVLTVTHCMGVSLSFYSFHFGRRHILSFFWLVFLIQGMFFIPCYPLKVVIKIPTRGSELDAEHVLRGGYINFWKIIFSFFS